MFSRHSVQITAVFSDVLGNALPNLCRSFYNETKAEMFFSVFAVALLAEGVDRNALLWMVRSTVRRSPSSRRAWIEIRRGGSASRPSWVALLAEGVDRNLSRLPTHLTAQRSPSSRRAWIEIRLRQHHRRPVEVALLAEGVDRNSIPRIRAISRICRPPRGGRG